MRSTRRVKMMKKRSSGARRESRPGRPLYKVDLGKAFSSIMFD